MNPSIDRKTQELVIPMGNGEDLRINVLDAWKDIEGLMETGVWPHGTPKWTTAICNAFNVTFLNIDFALRQFYLNFTAACLRSESIRKSLFPEKT